jgi:hypothetical protein
MKKPYGFDAEDKQVNVGDILIEVKGGGNDKGKPYDSTNGNRIRIRL